MFYTDKTVVFHEGKFCKVKEIQNSPYTQAMHYGNGVFEGIRAYPTADGTRLFKATEHFSRLQQSAAVMSLPCRYSVQELEQIAYELLSENHLKDAYVRPLLFGADGMRLESTTESLLFMSAWKWGRYLNHEPAQVGISSVEKPSPKAMPVNYKVSGTYVNSIMASNEVRRKGYDEAIMLDANGFVAQAPGANIFIEKNGELWTPLANNILAGITRNTLLLLAQDNDIVVHERNFTVADLLQADYAFLTGTAVEIAAIGSIEGIKFPMPYEKSICARLSKLYGDMVRGSYETSYTII